MTLHGQIRNGLVVLDKSGALPDGTKVTVRPILNKAKPGKRPKKSVKDKTENNEIRRQSEGTACGRSTQPGPLPVWSSQAMNQLFADTSWPF
jgi:hypothetical protein